MARSTRLFVAASLAGLALAASSALSSGNRRAVELWSCTMRQDGR